MTGCRKTPKNTNCGQVTGKPVCPCPKQKPFSVALPLGITLRHNGEEFLVEGNPTVADGTYDEIVVANGVIVSARVSPLPDIVPAPCAPRPGSGDGGGSVGWSLDPAEGNILSWTADGRLRGQVFVNNSDTIQVDGMGTSRSPFVFSLVDDDPDLTYLISGTPTILPVTGSGTKESPFSIEHKTSKGGEFAGFTFDVYGHLQGYDAPQTSYVTAVTEGPGITVTTPTPGVVRISLPSLNSSEVTYKLGAVQATIDPQGRIKGLTPLTVAADGTYDGFANAFTFSGGLLSSVESVPRIANLSFRHIFQPGRTSNQMSIQPTMYGKLRITYRGYLGDAIKEDPGGDEPVVYYDDGYFSLPLVVQLKVGSDDVTSYIQVLNKKFVSVDGLYAIPADGSFIVGASHTVSLTMLGMPVYTEVGIMDVDLCQ